MGARGTWLGTAASHLDDVIVERLPREGHERHRCRVSCVAALMRCVQVEDIGGGQVIAVNVQLCSSHLRYINS